MTAKLSPHAFRVWDNQERRYLPHDDELACFVKQDTERYIIEGFTGEYDLVNRPVFEGDRMLRICQPHNNPHEAFYRVIRYSKHYRLLDEETMWLQHNLEFMGPRLTVIGTIHDQPETSSK